VTGAEELQAQDLRRRLAEAEATIAALLSGQIDAVVDSTSHTPVLLAKAQAALRDERDRAQRYLDAPDVILLALDVDARITLVNRYACAVLGWSASDLVGRDWIETCLPWRMRDAFRNSHRDGLAGEITVFEHVVVTKSGEERLIGWRTTVLRDDDGRAIGTFGAGADLTERSRAAKAVATADERMRFALESAGAGIWDLDQTTGVLRLSETMEAQHGLGPGTFAGTFKAFVECVHPDDRSSVLETIRAAVADGTDFSLLYRALCPDGSIRWLSGTGRVLLGEDGTPVRTVGVSVDVTERRSLEDQYQQAQKMEAVGRLAGGVAHDFNNLLTVILGYCDLLLEEFDADDPRLGSLAQIHEAGGRAAGLTRQLLAFSRKQVIEPTLLDLNVVVSDLRPMLARLIGEDVRVLMGLRPNLALVVADRGQVEQVVMNLAVNARDAMPTGGTLTIETANVDGLGATTQPAASAGAYVSLTVTDTGTGMTPEVKARMFEPFFTTKEAGKGTGLGMATVYSIVTRCGGQVNVSSDLGKGTSFRIRFPRAEGEHITVPVPAPVRVAPVPTGLHTVLVVEDDESLRELARKILRRHGYNVLLAADANEARRVFSENPAIDVVLTDVIMPGESGPELTRQLVTQRPALKVIYMSGYTEEAIVHHGVLKLGIAFLNKPFTSETLGAKLREVLAL
jgi:two-component system, cell cycle sensor histidine kinase and response regulator CckA